MTNRPKAAAGKSSFISSPFIKFAIGLTELLAVEGIFLLRGLGFAEVSADEFKSVLLHARNMVLAALDRSA
jgi:hypothetical protein